MQIIGRLATGIAAAMLLAGAALAAEDSLKPGKWEFVTEMQGSNLPALPPGAKFPPGVQLRPGGGMNITHTTCVSANSPVPAGPPPATQGPAQPGQPDCKIDKMERNGGEVHWAMTCTAPEANTHAEGDAHYRGDRMEANVRTHATVPKGPASDVTQHITGRYLGACSGK
jgi:hypothetical protein